MIYHIGIGNTINHFGTPEPSAAEIRISKCLVKTCGIWYLKKNIGQHIPQRRAGLRRPEQHEWHGAARAAHLDGIYEAKRTK